MRASFSLASRGRPGRLAVPLPTAVRLARRLPVALSERALATALLATAGLVVAFWARIVVVPHMVEHVEVQVRSLTVWWQAGLFPYVHSTELPVLQNPYGPLYQWLCKTLASVDGHPYLVGRALSLAAILLVLAGVGTWVYRRTGNRWLAGLCALLPITTKPILLFAPLYRVDSLALLFSVAGFLIVTAVPDRRGVAFSVVAFGLAFCTKMTYVAAPLAATVALWQIGQHRNAVRLAGLIVLALPALVLLLEHLSAGAYLASATLGNLPSGPLKSLDMLLRVALTGFWIAALAVAGTQRGFDPARSPALIYTLASLFVAVVFAANPLSSWNYLMEFTVALALLTGEILGQGPRQERHPTSNLDESPRSLRRRSKVQTLLLLHAALALPLIYGWIQRASEPRAAYRQRYEAALHRLTPTVEAGSRVVILDSVAGRDALNTLGALSLVSVPPSLEASPLVTVAVDQALRRGRVEFVVRGDDWLQAERALAGSSRASWNSRK